MGTTQTNTKETAWTPPPGQECVEHGIWTPIPVPPPHDPKDFILKFSKVDPTEDQHTKEIDRLTFHLIGCSGNYDDHTAQRHVAEVLADQTERRGTLGLPGTPAVPASFLFHLGDIVYKPDAPANVPAGDDNGTETVTDKVVYNESEMTNSQFYSIYSNYKQYIFSVAGNHDGKVKNNFKHNAILHYIQNFCTPQPGKSPDNTTDGRLAMQQPYPYWRLDTHLATIIGLYTNVANGGMLDDPHGIGTPQYDWLVAQLEDFKATNAKRNTPHALLIALHYPPYSAASNFIQRGDPRLGPTLATNALPLGTVLQSAFAKSQQWPDAVFSAHAHLYQRLTYTRPAKKHGDAKTSDQANEKTNEKSVQIPYLICGSGGHTIESMGGQCSEQASPAHPPYAPLFPPNGMPPTDESVKLERYEDNHFGFLRITITPEALTGEYFVVYPGNKQPVPHDPGLPRLADAFRLDLKTHTITDLFPAPSA